MRCDAGFGDAIHEVGTNLDFEWQAFRFEQGRVQRLVTIDARDCNVILEATGHGFVEPVNQAEYLVAGADVIDDDAKAVYIDNITQQAFFLSHFSVDAVEVFFTTDNVGGNTVFGECLGKFFGDAFNDLTLVSLALF